MLTSWSSLKAVKRELLGDAAGVGSVHLDCGGEGCPEVSLKDVGSSSSTSGLRRSGPVKFVCIGITEAEDWARVVWNAFSHFSHANNTGVIQIESELQA
jgi:hypothetical protein